ncbi:uncharacterized protein LOC126709173 [Quercus robur]|uniref:uncharacterized protein LOC126709173 n=1 Tax=Quercus robur TaxID=38942 RepID=UPI0021635E17|nr:uncharacterized protein LOC126709173 [Quercus robur]
MKEHQKPELANRRFKDSSLKKLQKVTKKNLNAVFTSVSDESSKDELSSISEISESNHAGDITDSFSMTMSPTPTASSESLLPSDLTPSSTVTTENDEPGKLAMNLYRSSELDGSKNRSVEMEIVVDFLKKARSQASNSVDVDTRSKKLLDALLSIIVDEFYAQPEKKDRFAELIAMKKQIVLLCFVFWILAMAMTFFFSSRVENSFRGPPPT